MRVTARRLAQASVLLTAGLSAELPIAASASEQGDDAAALARRLQALRERVETIESKARPATTRTAPAQAVTGGMFPGSWKLPGSDTSIRFSGYVRTDVMVTTGASADRSIGDSFVLSSIPADNSAGSRQGSDVRLHARNSRVRLESKTPTEWGAFNTLIEGDFFGAGGNQRFSNSNGLRLLQAYGALGPVLAGQTHSTFMDQDSAPETVDKFGPAGDSNVRQAQIRYTHAFMPGLEADAAVENPSANATTPVGGANANTVDKLPDLVTRVRYRDSWGVVNVAGVARYFRYDDGSTGTDSAWGGGVHVGATIYTWDKDSLKFNFNFGPGLGRYVRTTNTSPELNVTCAAGREGRFVSGAVDGAEVSVTGGTAVRSSCGASASVNTVHGGWIQYQHWWNETLRTNLLLAYMSASVDVAAVGAGANGATRAVQSALVNLIWSPFARVSLGLEMMYGWREIARAAPGNGRYGQAGRLQAGMKLDF